MKKLFFFFVLVIISASAILAQNLGIKIKIPGLDRMIGLFYELNLNNIHTL